LIWNPNPDASDKVIVLQRQADIRRKERWPEYLDWMVRNTINMRRVFGPRAKNLQLDAAPPESVETELPAS
jgi:hypothetical protein